VSSGAATASAEEVIEADIVIVGAGSAGCVLANRLGEDTALRIVVLEAGPPDRDLMIHVPAGVHKVWRDPSLNWNYLTDAEPHLESGPLGVSVGRFDNPLYDAFLAAGEQAGQGSTTDPNGFDPEGVARLDATRWRGRRCSAAVAHLRPALARGNVRLKTGVQVERVLFDGRRATGVVGVAGDRTLEVRAGREVILCGGAINSPQLLMLSGIGPSAEIARHGIALRAEIPGVGCHLQDHASVILQTACTRAFPIHKVDQPLRKAAAGLQWVFTRQGIAASNIWEAGGLIRSGDTAEYPDLQYHFGPVGFEYENDRIRLRQAFALHVDQLRPRSRGSVTLASENPLERARMQFNYLEHPLDMAEMVAGVRRAQELVAQPAFDALRGESLDPISCASSDVDIERWVRANTSTDFHPCGTPARRLCVSCSLSP